MKKFGKLLAIAALAMVSYNASAELAPQWEKGTMVGNAAIGIQPFGAAVSLDYVLVDEWWMGHFTVGGEIDLRSQDHYGAWGLTPRCTYGLNITPEFEVHAMVGMGFGSWNYKYDGYKSHDTFILHNEFVGCRYFFADNLAALAEVGYSNWFPEVRAGISFKF